MVVLVTKMWCPPDLITVSGGCRQRGWLNWGVSATAGFLGYLPRQGSLGRSLPKPPSEGEMRELLTALDSHDPPGHPVAAPPTENGSGGKQPSNSSSSQTLQYSFKLTVGVAETAPAMVLCLNKCSPI